MNSISLQFSTSTAWQSAIIRILCGSPFSHVDLVLPDGNLLGASDSPEAPVIEGNPHGVAIRPPAYQEWGLSCTATLLTNNADAIIAAAKTQLGKPFDNAALHSFLVDPLLPKDRLWMKQWVGSKLLAGFSELLVDHWLPPQQIKSFLGQSEMVKDWRDESAWFCAELVGYAFEAGGYWNPRKLDWPLKRLSPTDLLLVFAMDLNFINRNRFWSGLEQALNQRSYT